MDSEQEQVQASAAGDSAVGEVAAELAAVQDIPYTAVSAVENTAGSAADRDSRSFEAAFVAAAVAVVAVDLESQ